MPSCSAKSLVWILEPPGLNVSQAALLEMANYCMRLNAHYSHTITCCTLNFMLCDGFPQRTRLLQDLLNETAVQCREM